MTDPLTDRPLGDMTDVAKLCGWHHPMHCTDTTEINCRPWGAVHSASARIAWTLALARQAIASYRYALRTMIDTRRVPFNHCVNGSCIGFVLARRSDGSYIIGLASEIRHAQ